MAQANEIKSRDGYSAWRRAQERELANMMLASPALREAILAARKRDEAIVGAMGSFVGGMGLGVYAAKYPDRQKMLGLDVELVVAGVGLSMALIPQVSKKLGGITSSAVEGIGNGGLSVYSYRKGLEHGNK